MLQSETGWNGDTNTSQYTRSHDHCNTMDGESYSACDFCNRDHVRLNETWHQDTLGRYETVGTPHREVVSCPGHAVTSFIAARNAILNAMDPPYGYTYQYWGNNQPRTQCNGANVASDGYVLWVNIG